MPWLLYLVVPFCSVFVLAGGGLMVASGRKIWEGCRAAHWPHTTGTVLAAESKDVPGSESDSREVVVRYAYAVGGRAFEGPTVHPTYGPSSFEEAHRGLERVLVPGRKVRVYYHAEAPDRSTLAVGFYSGSLAAFFGGALFAAVGLGFLLTFWFALAGNWDYASGITLPE